MQLTAASARDVHLSSGTLGQYLVFDLVFEPPEPCGPPGETFRASQACERRRRLKDADPGGEAYIQETAVLFVFRPYSTSGSAK